MDRRQFLDRVLLSAAGLGCVLAGCKGQTAQIMDTNEPSMVGSHQAGSETYNKLVDEAVAKLLGRQHQTFQTTAHEELPAPTKKICFVCVENKSAEELGDFKEQLYQQIDTQIVQSRVFAPISKRFVDAGLQETRLRPDQLMVPDNMRAYCAHMEQMGQSFDYLLYATLTSGTTHDNKDYQRDYLLTMELVNVHNGQYDKESASLRKGYNVSTVSKIKNFSWFK